MMIQNSQIARGYVSEAAIEEVADCWWDTWCHDDDDDDCFNYVFVTHDVI